MSEKPKPGLADSEYVDEISVAFPYHDRLVKQLAVLQKRLEREQREDPVETKGNSGCLFVDCSVVSKTDTYS